MSKVERYIITGAPCTGKSTLIKAISEKGYTIFNEAARLVIQQQLGLKSNKVPWLDNLAFSELVMDLQIKDYHSAINKINFFDRGIPDVLAYIKHFNTKKDWEKFKIKADNFPYSKTVFLLPPWKEIYKTDTERIESFEDSIDIHQSLFKTYQKLNYNIIELPLLETNERVNFILEMINNAG